MKIPEGSLRIFKLVKKYDFGYRKYGIYRIDAYRNNKKWIKFEKLLDLIAEIE